MNDTILVIIAFLIIGLGLYELSEDNNLRPASKSICSVEYREINPDCIKVRKEEVGDIEGLK